MAISHLYSHAPTSVMFDHSLHPAPIKEHEKTDCKRRSAPDRLVDKSRAPLVAVLSVALVPARTRQSETELVDIEFGIEPPDMLSKCPDFHQGQSFGLRRFRRIAHI